MDARAYRLPELAGRKAFELDVKPVLEYKTGVLAEVRGCDFEGVVCGWWVGVRSWMMIRTMQQPQQQRRRQRRVMTTTPIHQT